MTKRPVIVTVGTAIQTCIAVIFTGAAVLFAVLNSTVPSQGLKTAFFIILPLAAGAVVASWGMWKRRAWGWWTALAFNVLAFLSMMVDLIDGDADLADFIFTTIFFACLGLLLSGPVRRHFLRSAAA
jgi:hypothetical protein